MINGDFENFSWSLFTGSGGIGYYMLYKSLENDRELEEIETREKGR